MAGIAKRFIWGTAWMLVSLNFPAQARGQHEFARAVADGDLVEIRSMVDTDAGLLSKPLPQKRMAPLHFAIQNRNLDVVKLLVELGAPLDNKNPQKTTALHTALTRGSPEIFERILQVSDNVDSGDRNQMTPLMYAVIHRNSAIENIDKLIARGANVNAVNSNKQTALHLAGYYGRPRCGVKLIAAGADLTVVDRQEMTPFLAACSTSAELAAELLARDSDPLSRNRRQQTALHLACQGNRADVVQLVIDHFEDVNVRDQQFQTPLQLAINHNNQKLVQMLIDRGADPNDFGSVAAQQQIDPVICYPAMTGNQPMLKILVDAGADVDVRNRQGASLAHLAARGGVEMHGNGTIEPKIRAGYLATIQTLIRHQANVNIQNKAGEMPIEIAAKGGFYPAVELLIDHTKSLDFEFGESSLIHWTAKNGLMKTMTRALLENPGLVNEPDSTGRIPLHWAVEQGHLENVQLLIRNKARIDDPDQDGLTPLMLAAESGHADVVQTLVSAGADAQMLDGSGQSALHLAAWNGSADVVSLLLSTVGQSSLKTQTGYTPLHAAAWNGHAGVVRELLNSGADPNATDSDGWTPLHKAAYRGHTETVSELLKGKADKNRINAAGMIPLEMAEGNQKSDVVALLR